MSCKYINKCQKMLLKTLNNDLDKICRLCLSLFQSFETETMAMSKIPDIINKIKDCVSLEIEFDQKFPSKICVACLHQINQWVTFRDVCHQSQNILLESVSALHDEDEKPIKNELDIPEKEELDIPEKEECEDSSEDIDNDDPYDETYEPDVQINSPAEEKAVLSIENEQPKRKTRQKSIPKIKVKHRNTSTQVKVKRKLNKTKIKRPKIVIKQEVESSSESDDESLEDTVEALEKYLYKLNQEDAENELRQEILQIHDYECEICRSVFNSMFDYLDHQEIHNGQAVFQCHRCVQVFTSRVDLVDHDSRHQVPCPKCAKMILPGCLKTHMVLHTDKYKCPQCNWRFCNSTMLRQHVESVHIRIKTHVCETCGKSFTSTTSLQTHIKIHSDARPYICKICEYSGRTASALYTHMARHENGLHVCEVCAKSFKSFRSLRDHTRRVHSEKKNHECGFCQKKFVDKYMLTVHTRTHTGARPYQCKLCDRAFVRSDGLREHLATHGQRASYSCQQCGKKFIYRRSLGRHTCTAVIN